MTVQLKKIRKLIEKIFPPLYSYKMRKHQTEIEIEVIPMLLSLKGSSGTVLDIGANLGCYSEYLLRKCKDIYVHAFEPQPDIFDSLKNLRFYKRISLYNVGLAEQESNMELYIPIINGATDTAMATLHKLKTPHKKLVVPVKTLDRYNFKNVIFVKIDVEGLEYEVLLGGKETIKTNRPIMLIEIEERHLIQKENKVNTVGDVIASIEDSEYKCFYYRNNKLISADNLNILQAQALNNLYTTKYVNNFFFIPIELIPKLKKRGLIQF